MARQAAQTLHQLPLIFTLGFWSLGCAPGDPTPDEEKAPAAEVLNEASAAIIPASAPGPNTSPSEKIRAFTGARTRFAWMQSPNIEDYYGILGKSRLIVLDTDDGLGERVLHDLGGSKASVSKPMISDDGQTVVFTNQRTRRVYSIPFEGGELTEIAEGYGADVWRDPQTGTDWVYVKSVFGGTLGKLFRVQLKDPGVREDITDEPMDIGVEFGSWLQLSPDGSRAVDAFPWPKCGLISLPEGDWEVYQNGCWPSMAPDNTHRFFIFDGNHIEATFFDGDGQKVDTLRVNDMLSDRKEPVYHPRWSSHPRFLTVTAPFQAGESELYIGRFREDYAKVEEWLQVSHNDVQEFFGDAWIEPEAGALAASPPPSATKAAAGSAEKQEDASWPLSHEDLVLLWEDALANNQIKRGDGSSFTSSGTLSGRARFTRHSGINLSGGGFAVTADRAAWEQALVKDGAFTLELGVELLKDAPGGRLVRIGADDDAGALSVHISSDGALTIQSPDAGPKPLGRIEPCQPVHLVLEFRDSKVRSWLNGAPGQAIDFVLARSLPATGEIRFGDGELGARVERIAGYGRQLEDRQIQRHAAFWKSLVGTRHPAREVVVEAELIEQTASPAPESLDTYRRALVENLYRVREVISGSLEEEEIVVTQWAVMDRKSLQELPVVGEIYRLTIQPREDRPELAGEWTASDLTAFDLPVWHDVSVPAP